MAGRRANGEGTIYRRKDGRYEAAIMLMTRTGQRKRFRVCAKTRQEAHDKLVTAQMQAQQGTPIPDTSSQLGEYLNYWLENVVRPNRRPSTYERYEVAVRLHIRPILGGCQLTRLSVPLVQAFLNQKLADGSSTRNVQIMREVLRAALGRAVREELLVRNVAGLVDLPKWERAPIRPWNAAEARQFLAAAHDDPLYPAFVLLLMYGLRRGEIVGLRWLDVDLDEGVVRIRQQIQRVNGSLRAVPVKTQAGQRDLPLLPTVRNLLRRQGTQQSEYVVSTRTGQPIEPHNLSRSFHRLSAQHGLRRIRLHDLRHTTATLLKDCGVAARDAQLILGHSTVVITQEIYQHDDLNSRTRALSKVEALLTEDSETNTNTRLPPPEIETGGRSQACAVVASRDGCRQKLPSNVFLDDLNTTILSGRGDRIRTCDTWFWSSIDYTLRERLTSVNSVVQAWSCTWKLGCVAVKIAVSDVACHGEGTTVCHELGTSSGRRSRAVC
jgi:integrase